MTTTNTFGAAFAVCLLVGGLLLPRNGKAQEVVHVTPDTLAFDDDNPADYDPGDPEMDIITLVNIGDDTLTVDSLGHSRYRAAAWWISVVENDSVVVDVHLGSFDYAFQSVDLTIAPADTALLWVRGYDPCTVCGGLAAKKAMSPHITDTFFIHHTPSGTGPRLVYIDTENVRNAVEEPAHINNEISVDVHPNPIRDDARVTIHSAHTGIYQITVFDLLGRRLRHRSVHLTAGRQQEIDWTRLAGTVSAGTYLLRVVGPERQTVARATTVVE